MRRQTISLLVAVVTLSLVIACAPTAAPEPESTIEGVWQSVEITTTNDEGTATRPISQPNLLIFAAGHYASLTIFGQEPREMLPEEPTDEQALAAWRPFAANAGTYEIVGSSINTRVIVAKSPNRTANNDEESSEFELDGDVLHRTFTNDAGNTFLVKFERQE